ncbi:Sugar phosphate transporter domain containing protein [Quillaja saponaria]|uniref:Sugar phosphate transporter domain containing protein n=1 Tax=Quillaja saponaria TaxID=32244 RepID=A0AAD7LT70_QUISA|nr:Sugar phosphate transporter domain containing protein [Quillaja saponaria]
MGFVRALILCFNEVGRLHLDHQVENRDTGLEEDSDLELRFLQQFELQNGSLDKVRFHNVKSQLRSMHLNGVDSMYDASAHIGGNVSEKFMPFDIESKSTKETNGDDASISMGTHGALQKNSKSPISVANVLKTLFFILVWYTSSLFLTLYNKSLLGDDLGRFPAPFVMNTVHFAMQAALSRFITWFWSHKFQPSVAMSWMDYYMRVVPTALGTAMDVNLSNASLVSISVTFATMCKSASPIFLLLFAFAFRLETPSIKLSGIILIISFGILLTVAKETEFEFWGFIFVMLAAVMSGFRWCMTQILLQKEACGLKNPLTLMSYVAPVMAVVTAFLSLVLDPWHEFKINNYFNNPWHITRSCLLMLFGGTLAFFMVLTEYILVSVTSAVTVTIAGVVKEAITILVAVFYFHDEFTWLKGVGLLTIMVGVCLFNWYKYQKLQKGQINGDDRTGPLTADIAARYVILEEMEEQDDSS